MPRPVELFEQAEREMVRPGGRNLDRGGNVNELSHNFRFASRGRPR